MNITLWKVVIYHIPKKVHSKRTKILCRSAVQDSVGWALRSPPVGGAGGDLVVGVAAPKTQTYSSYAMTASLQASEGKASGPPRRMCDRVNHRRKFSCPGSTSGTYPVNQERVSP